MDHIDQDFHNNSWRNLRILDQATHSREDCVRVELLCVSCVWCNQEIFVRPSRLDYIVSLDRAGPFCSRRCSGRFGSAVRNGKVENEDGFKKAAEYQQSPVYYTAEKRGETVVGLAKRLGLELPTENEILAALPRNPQESQPENWCSCLVCTKPTTNKKYCSVACSAHSRQKVRWPSKEKLHRLVWKYPTSYIAKRLGVSDPAVAKHCKKLGIDKPPRGYWQRKRTARGGI